MWMARLTANCILSTVLAAGLGSFLAACGSAGGSIPIEQYKEESSDGAGEYVIGVGDMLVIQVWDQEKMSGRMRVRSDGRISLPFVNDVEAAGKTPGRLAADLETGLKT